MTTTEKDSDTLKHIQLNSFSLLLGIVTLFSARVAHADSKEITVFAAASMTEVIQESCAAFEKDTGIKVKLNLGSSGKLARQIEAGAQANIFISASKRWVDHTTKEGFIKNSSVKPFLSNSLVVIAPLDSDVKPFKVSSKIDSPSLFEGRLSVGDPNFVPAGQYAMEALKYCECDKIFKKRLLPGANVRTALMMVELGEVEMGIVYKTDAIKSSKVKVLSEFPVESHSQIVYYHGMSKDAKPATQQFYDWLTNTRSNELYKKHGFKPLGSQTANERKFYVGCKQA